MECVAKVVPWITDAAMAEEREAVSAANSAEERQSAASVDECAASSKQLRAGESSDATLPWCSPSETSPVVLSSEERRVRFHHVQGLRVDQKWQERPVGVPCYDAWQAGPSWLGYFENYRAAVNFGKGMQNSNLVQVILRDHGYDKVDVFEHLAWSIFWCSGLPLPEYLSGLRPWQRINKFPQTTALTSKLALWTHFEAMQKLHGGASYDFMPECFVLPGSLEAYESHLARRLSEPDGANDLWILKPDDVDLSKGVSLASKGASCGIGIFLHRATRSSRWGGWGGGGGGGLLSDAVRRHRGVACRYIDPPMLMGGYKSDVRLYVLVTSFHPLVCYLYNEGLGRFATEPYTTRDIETRTAHLTNYSINKHSSTFVAPQATLASAADADATGSKWTLSAYKKRMVEQLGEAVAARAWASVDDLIIKALLAVEPTVTRATEAQLPAEAHGAPNQHCFQVFGFDVLFDAAAKPWLLEANLDPSLDADTPLDLKVKAAMLADLLHVVGPSAPTGQAVMRAAAGSPQSTGRPQSRRVAPNSAPNASDRGRIAALSSRVTSDLDRVRGLAAHYADDNTEHDQVNDKHAERASDGSADGSGGAGRANRTADGTPSPAVPAATAAAVPAVTAATAAAAAAVAAAVLATAPDPPALAALSDLELWTLHVVDTEYARSKAAGGWRRLLPCARSAQYMPFVEPERRRRNSLPFDVMPMLCKRGHAMERRTTAPSYYKSNVRCDECWVRCDEHIFHFFHCSTCRYDLCPDCVPPRPVLPPPTPPSSEGALGGMSRAALGRHILTAKDRAHTEGSSISNSRSGFRERSKQHSRLAVDKEKRPVSSPTEQDLELPTTARTLDDEDLCELQPLEA